MMWMYERRFRAMNTDAAAWLWSDDPRGEERLGEVEALFRHVEAQLSRFRPESELNRLNSSAGTVSQPVSPLLLTVLGEALWAAEDSDGIFDPTVLTALNRAGYDRSFELVASGPVHSARESTTALAKASWRLVQLNREHGSASLPEGIGIDLGGIGKGFTVDRAAEMAGRWGAALVDAGGDIRSSAAPGGEPWPIAIQHPTDESKDLGVVRLAGGAIATSTTRHRTWTRDGKTMHHLIDPRSGEPCRSDLHTVTVLGPTAVEAEVAAKVVLILGSQEGRSYLEKRGLAGVMMDNGERARIVGDVQIEQWAEV